MNTDERNGDVQIPAEDSLEFRLLLAYTRKKRPTDSRLQKNNAEEKTFTPEDLTEGERKKNKRRKIKFSKLFRCIKPKTSDLDDDQRQPATLECEAAEKVDDMEDMASKLTEISDTVHFTPCEIESDSQDDIIQTIVELLKEHGDRLNDKIMADKDLRESLQSSLTYGFFSSVMDRFFRSVTPELPPQQETEKTKVALICEATSKLFSVDHHPMNRVLGFGAKYLQDKFPKWISRNMDNEEVEEKDEEEEVH